MPTPRIGEAMVSENLTRRKLPNQGSLILAEGTDELPVADSGQWATCLSTMQRQHETLMHRLDLQDDLLDQLIQTNVRKTPLPAPHEGHQMRADLGADRSSAIATKPSDDSERERKQPGQSGAVKSWISTSFDMSRMTQNISSSRSARPRLFKSYTNQELEKKREAHSADASRSRAIFSRNKQPQKADAGARLVVRIVEHPAFDVFFASIVLVNSILIGVDVENMLQDLGQPVSVRVLQYLCTSLFLTELILRVSAAGCQVFWSEDWAWMFLDVLIVTLSLWEIVVDIAEAYEEQGLDEGVSGISSLKAFRIIRLTRILKTAQLMRVFRFVMALRTLVQSVLHTMKALLWALLLLLLIVYVFAVLFTQAMHDYRMDPEIPEPKLPEDVEFYANRYFSSLVEGMLCLFMSIAGGVSWEQVILPLTYVSWLWVGCFIMYISFTYFAVLNVVTAVFCQSAIESAQNDHATVVQNMLDNKESHLKKLRALFSKFDIQQNGGITYGMFEEKMNSPAVREYFETLGLDVWDPWSFFKLLDEDGGGLVEIEEFFMGCLRFSGQARAMDVGKIIQDQAWIIRNQGRFHSYVEGELVKLHEKFGSLTGFLQTMSQGVASAQL
mmetsp:Transcript_10883/g.26083  ORF Transcript_10883/g.26083 Transcript_10883/m.26083 type:complete len:613 (+) Transcript_10883:3-1841(+)